MARANSWRWESLVQDIIGRNLVKLLIQEPIKLGDKFLSAEESLFVLEELTPAFYEACKRVIAINSATKK